MATQVVYLASSVSGSAANPNNALGNTPSTWAGTANSNTSWTHRWAFTNPTEDTLTGTQSLTVTVRKGSNSNNPTLSSISVYQGGTLVARDSVSKSISSTTGQTFTVNWDGSGSSADVHLELVTSSAGGSPSARNSIEFSHSAWTAQTLVPNLPPVITATYLIPPEGGWVAGSEHPAYVEVTASDPEGQSLTYNFAVISGGSGGILIEDDSPTVPFATLLPIWAGDYVIRATVTDPGGASSFHDFNITVNSPPPTSQWFVVEGGVEVALPSFEGIVENGAITPGTMGET